MYTIINYNTEVGDFATRMVEPYVINVAYSIPNSTFVVKFTVVATSINGSPPYFSTINVDICDGSSFNGADVWLANRAIQFCNNNIIENAFKDHAKIQVGAAS